MLFYQNLPFRHITSLLDHSKKNSFYPEHTHYRHTIVAVWALLFVICLIFGLFQPVNAQTGIIAGIKSTDWDRYIHLGTIQKINPRWSLYFNLEAGGGEYSLQPRPVMSLPLNKLLTLSFILGPEIDILSDNPTADETITYLAAATTAALSVKATDQLSLILAIDYRETNAPISSTKFGVGAVFWITDI